MKAIKKTRGGAPAAALVALAGFSLLGLSCAKQAVDDPAAAATGSGSVAVPAQPATTSSGPAAPERVVGGGEATPTETPASAPSPAVLNAVSAVQARLDGIVAGVDGAHVRFISCDEAAACSTRIEASTPEGLLTLLQSVSRGPGGIDFTAREALDAYLGRTFVADVTLSPATARDVPTNANDLLGIAP